LQSQHQYKLSEEFCFGQVVVSWTMGGINKMFPLRLVDIDSFQFFHQLDLLNFIDITNNLNLLTMFHYKNVKLNLNIEQVCARIRTFVDTSSNQCILAGGCFTDYVSESTMALKFHDLFNNILCKKDFDFYMLDDDSVNFNFYLHKFKSQNLIPYAINNDVDYDFNCFKVNIDNFILNMVFVNKKYKKRYINSILEIVYFFDFNLCKIFYSFTLKAIYFDGSLFTPFLQLHNYESIIQRKGREDCTAYLNKFKYCNHICVEYINAIRGISIKNSPSGQELLNDICEFLDTYFIRTIKYYFKCFYVNCERDQKLFELIEYFYSIFATYLLDQTSEVRQLVRSERLQIIHKCLLIKSNEF
jgi:hypothetical protein